MVKKKDVDWLGLEVDYRAGIKSMRALAQEYGISTARIGQVAEENRWKRNLAAKIKARTQEKLDSSLLDTHLDAKTASEKDVVEAASQTQTNIILAHRADIRRARSVALSLLMELELSNYNKPLLEELGDLMRSPDDNKDKLYDLYTKVISLPGRVDAAKKMAETYKVVVSMEREAFGIASSQAVDGLSVPNNLMVSFVASGSQ